MIVGPNGQPMVTAGPTGREIVLQEVVVKERKSWGIDVKGTVDALEAVQVLADSIKAITMQQRAMIAENKLNHKVAEQIKQMGKENVSEQQRT